MLQLEKKKKKNQLEENTDMKNEYELHITLIW